MSQSPPRFEPKRTRAPSGLQTGYASAASSSPLSRIRVPLRRSTTQSLLLLSPATTRDPSGDSVTFSNEAGLSKIGVARPSRLTHENVPRFGSPGTETRVPVSETENHESLTAVLRNKFSATNVRSFV